MADSFECTLTSTLDLPALERRLNDAELRVLRKGGDRIVSKIKARWIGWKYESAPPDKRGRSRAGWKRTLTSNTSPVTLTIRNDARDYYKGAPYVQHVTRSGERVPEYVAAFAEVIAVDVPILTVELTTAILAAIDVPAPPRRVRANKASETVTATLK